MPVHASAVCLLISTHVSHAAHAYAICTCVCSVLEACKAYCIASSPKHLPFFERLTTIQIKTQLGALTTAYMTVRHFDSQQISGHPYDFFNETSAEVKKSVLGSSTVPSWYSKAVHQLMLRVSYCSMRKGIVVACSTTRACIMLEVYACSLIHCLWMHPDDDAAQGKGPALGAHRV